MTKIFTMFSPTKVPCFAKLKNVRPRVKLKKSFPKLKMQKFWLFLQISTTIQHIYLFKIRYPSKKIYVSKANSKVKKLLRKSLLKLKSIHLPHSQEY